MSKQIAHGLRAGIGLVAWSFLCVSAMAHVVLDAPNGGETLNGGSIATIEWHVQISHNTNDWDLWYSSVSDQGPWEEIVSDVPKGDTTEGAVHNFQWTLPNENLPETWVRVRQDNAGMDYEDVSDASFSVVSVLGGGDFTGDGQVDGLDLAAWEKGYGQRSGAAPASGDADLDADVDGADFLAWQGDFTGAGAAAASLSIPETATAALMLIALIITIWQRF